MNNKDFTCLSDEELKLFGKQLNAALMTFKHVERRMSKMARRGVVKNDTYSKLLTMSIDVAIEISTRKEIKQ